MGAQKRLQYTAPPAGHFIGSRLYRGPDRPGGGRVQGLGHMPPPPPIRSHSRTHPPPPLSHTHALGTAKQGAAQEKRLKENSSGTAEPSWTSFGLSKMIAERAGQCRRRAVLANCSPGCNYAVIGTIQQTENHFMEEFVFITAQCPPPPPHTQFANAQHKAVFG